MDAADLRRLLHEYDAEHVPPDADEGLLDAALFFAERQKTVRFPESHDPADAHFRVDDKRLRARVLHRRISGGDAGTLAEVIEDAARRAEACPETHVVLALDGRDAGVKEYELHHTLWGRVTLFDYPHKPTMPEHPEVHAARDRGWGTILKERNLLPGRGIVVQDGDHGLLLTHDATRRFCAFLLRPAGTEPTLEMNPFGDAVRDDPEFRHWPRWGSGTSQPSEWVTVLDESERDRSG